MISLAEVPGERDMPIYVTQMGWGTTDGSNLAVPARGLEWLHYTDENEQALLCHAQAFELVQSLWTTIRWYVSIQFEWL